RGAGPHVQDAGPGCSASAQRETVMTAIRQILCATDLSPASEPACEEALRLARAWQAELLLLHVIPPVVFPAEGIFPPRLYRTLVDAVHREAHAGMDRLLERVPDPMLKVRMRIQEGVPASGILDAVGEEAIDLIVMGTHGRAGPQRLLLGSVADRVVRQASCPVMTVRAGMAPRGSAIRRLCYATDFSPTARAACPWVVALAEATGASVDLMHVTLLPVADRHLPPDAIGEMARRLHEGGRLQAEQFLAETDFPRDRVSILVGRGV